jgi:oxygen-dependent protoporphyrinogen oxidase
MNASTTDQTWVPRVAIIGGGLSGLAAAHRLGTLAKDAGRPLELVLFEAGEALGGLVGTKRLGDYLVETGADSFITNKPWAIQLCRELGIEECLLPTDPTFRRSLVLRNGKPVPVPEGFMLLSPAKIWPVLTSPIFTWRGKLRMAMEYFVGRNGGGIDESLASFVRRRFGREALDRLVQPLVGGIYTSDPEKLSLAATLPRFLDMEREHRSLIRASRKKSGKQSDTDGSGARYGLFAAPKNGISELADALAKAVDEVAEVRTETRVSSVEPVSLADDTSWEVHTSEGRSEQFTAVVLALPAYRIGDLVTGFDQQLAKALQSIKYASSAIVASGHRLKDITHPLDAFGLVIPAIENRRILAVSFASRKFPGRAPEGRVILRTFVGGAMQPELCNLDDEQLKQLVREELADMLGVSGEEDFSLIARYNRAMPQYHVGHLERVAQIESQAEKYAGLALAGNAFHGVGIPDTVHSGQNAAEKVFNAISKACP